MGPFERQVEVEAEAGGSPLGEAIEVEEIDRLLRTSDAAKQFEQPLRALAAEQKTIIRSLDGLKRAGAGMVQIEVFVQPKSRFYRRIESIRQLADNMLTQLRQIST